MVTKKERTEKKPWDPQFKRRVYVRNRSSLSHVEKPYLDLLDHYKLKYLDEPDRSFLSPRPLLVEIGFGNGRILSEFARRYPDWNCLGVDVYKPGIAQLIKQCEQLKLKNVRILMNEGHTVLEQMPNRSIDKLWVFFPDPWPKTKHHKRRLVTPEFVDLVSYKVRGNRYINLATDADDYALEIHRAFMDHGLFWGGKSRRLKGLPISKYERRGQRLKHNMHYFEFTRLDVEIARPQNPSVGNQIQSEPICPVALLPPPPTPK
ncbi:MAG: tRNA (guanosine(46)-N7)-methyltransferase TrmB [Gammaproteobacteria bacterium]|nr:tRNA (guanosine(46)-N7)-methyltransferase TrmB [Gammaproteobacteria bacterium]